MSKTCKKSCLCGGVALEVTPLEESVHVCHCSLCQTWNGGPAFAVSIEPEWKTEGEEKLKWFDSSEWGQRGFCSECGTHMLFRTKDGSYNGVCAPIDGMADFKIGEHIFVDRKPFEYDFSDDTPRLTAQQFHEMIGAA
ncbi:MAG: GFA family protein [Pseudomonadota bacterium]|nr:GFA family protein [Pseudomonadota bacterium]